MITVVGGGPAGRNAAVYMAHAGEEVRLIESGGKSGIGGQCLHYGCMLVCGLNDVARVRAQSAVLRRRGILGSLPDIDFEALVAGLSEVQGKIAEFLDKETRDAGIEIIYGKEAHVQGKTVLVDDDPHTPDHLLIATGSCPLIPDVPGIGLPGVYTSHTFSEIPSLPRRITVVGGGIMAAEFAFIFQSLGSTVDLVSRSGFLKNLDPRLREAAIRDLSGITLHEHARLVGIGGEEAAGSVRFVHEGEPEEVNCDAVFLAAGLAPRSEHISGIEKGALGEILVNGRMETSVSGVYAAGDVTGCPCLTPVARREGMVAADNILGRPCEMNYTLIPQSMNLMYEYAFARNAKTEGVSLWVPGPAGPGTFWSVPEGRTGMAKLTADPDSGEIEEICVAAPAGGIIAAYSTFLVSMGVNVHDFQKFLEVHPEADGLSSLIKYASLRFGRENLT
ncbi:dihydrolipoamide dehydrogenase [Methanolinea mesophila]|uniref:FAD-dependent oxidoreductase n=1 Tax=Methanolinea mesophila TaxID=547055 RepID=UPI001AE19A58|nr:NAD(P)/FAD-dependent oxidoreductase [Methanolinea mesophila]MBP1929320.1 dihydrolipoamide dehydrogenase [Methanolinea mesophila]